MHKKGKIIFYILFSALFIFYLASNIYWIYGNYSIKGQTVANHLSFSVEFFYKFTDIIYDSTVNIWNKLYKLILLMTQQLPQKGDYDEANATYLITTLFYLVFGNGLFVAKISNFVYIVILAVSVFLITKDISTKFAAIISVFLVLMCPLIFESLRQYGTDLPLTAMIALAFLFFLRCKNFGSLKYSVLLGLTVGIGMLVKGHLLFYIMIPFIYSIYYIIFKEKTFNIRYLNNILIFMIISSSLASLWWVPHFIAARKLLFLHIVEAQTMFNRTYLQIFITHIKMLIFSSIGFPVFIFLFPGIYFFVIDNIEEKPVLLSWILVPIFIFTFISFETLQKYLMPILPAVAIVTSCGLCKIKNRKINVAILTILIFLSSSQFYRLTFNNTRKFKKPDSITFWGGTSFGDVRHTSDDYKISKMLEKIRGQVTDKKIDILAVLFTQDGPLPFELRYRVRVSNREWNLFDAVTMHDAAYCKFNSLDFVVLRIPDNINPKYWPSLDEFVYTIKHYASPFIQFQLSKCEIPEKLYERIYENRVNFDLLDQIQTDFGYKWVIYRKL